MLNIQGCEMYNLLQKAGNGVANSLGDPCSIHMARGSPRLPRTGLEVVDSADDLCAICMIKST